MIRASSGIPWSSRGQPRSVITTCVCRDPCGAVGRGRSCAPSPCCQMERADRSAAPRRTPCGDQGPGAQESAGRRAVRVVPGLRADGAPAPSRRQHPHEVESRPGRGLPPDDHRVVGVVVQADEAEVGQGPETSLAQMAGDLVVAGRGDLAGPAGLGRGDPDQVALLVGQCEKQQAMGFVLAGEVFRLSAPVRRRVRTRVPSNSTTTPPRRAIFFSARSSRGARPDSRVRTSARQHR